MCWSFSAQHWISKYKNILVIGILHAGKLHEFGVWIKRPQRKKILCMHTACYPVHPLHEKFCYQNNMSFCLHLTLLSCRIGAFILQAQVFRYPGFLLLRHKFISLFMIFGVQIQTTNYQPGYFVLFFFSLLYGAVVSHRVKINKIIYLHPLKPHPMSGKA